MSSIATFKDLLVWQRAYLFCRDVYRITRGFPADERFGLVSELRKTARSIVNNIAEGHRRKSTADYVRFLDISYASTAEIETQLLLANDLGYLNEKDAQTLFEHLGHVDRMLPALMKALRERIS